MYDINTGQYNMSKSCSDHLWTHVGTVESGVMTKTASRVVATKYIFRWSHICKEPNSVHHTSDLFKGCRAPRPEISNIRTHRR